jgi:hypothetical protein
MRASRPTRIPVPAQEMVCNAAATISAYLLGTWASTLRRERTSQRARASTSEPGCEDRR